LDKITCIYLGKKYSTEIVCLLCIVHLQGQFYGNGIYFSEIPGVSIQYGVLLLCRTLPGRVQDIGPIGDEAVKKYK
jgi:hypothetical protein